MTEYLSLKKRKIELDLDKEAHGWIQWKGTDVCIDIHCECGALSHYDGDFMYFIQCEVCERIYEVNGYIQLIKRKKEDVDSTIKISGVD